MPFTQPEDFESFLLACQDKPELSSVALELEALRSIYGEDTLRLHRPPDSDDRDGPIVNDSEGWRVRYEVEVPLTEDPEVTIVVLVTLPPNYPESSKSPQLQLLNRYVGDFGVDSDLFGRVLRTFFSIPPPDGDGVPFVSGDVAVWEGLEHVRGICQEWYTNNTITISELSATRDAAHPQKSTPSSSRPSSPPQQPASRLPTQLPEGIVIYTSEPIVDRKSVFIGRAVQITDPAHIPIILNYLLEDKKISKAAHPIIHAYRLHGPGGSIIQDNDDDGETAAGGRIAHLLQILDVMDVLVVVSRWFGGTHLGADRFKHIGQAARDCLEVGGFLEEKNLKASSGKKK
ncbi:Uncharacterized conserved protein [Phaffia rhodozyma]|uniref:Uncharacterized conserved protein n=1 Tax=Phaffia rhodozyma TaxID=264483 RepID=A0A0F7SLH2_PHARH|nr:Uncharacterized conserved protein [Phaffia rhodozyma]